VSTNKNKIKISVIIPVYNEKRVISNCLASLAKQDINNFEVIVVDDGSEDNTFIEIKKSKHLHGRSFNLKLLRQAHKGPGEARNLAAKLAEGNILVFLDADMTLDSKFLQRIIEPIKRGVAVGTDSQDGYLGNPENFWARCWNIGRFAAANNFTKDYLKYITTNKKDHGGIFRAILKKDFKRVGGFERGGDYTDDASLAKKLYIRARIVGAKFYHWNPDTLKEVWLRARWIGSGVNFTRTTALKVRNLIKFSLPFSFLKGLVIGFRFGYTRFVIFKIVYDLAIWTSVLKSL